MVSGRQFVPLLVGGLLLAGHRSGGAQETTRQWRFIAPQGAEAWFAILSAARFEGLGALPFYKRSPGTPHVPSPLRVALSRDAAFEVLHFLPLFHPTADARQLAVVLRDVAAARGTPRPSATAAGFATAALAAVLPTPAQRATLAALATLVDSASVGHTLVAPTELAALQMRWDSAFAPRLAPYLTRERLRAGVVVLAPSLGPEGRFFAGRADDPADNVIAVSPANGDDATDATLFSVVRELCFPIVSRVAPRVIPSTDRAAYARRTSLAAVRCGDSLMTVRIPELAVGYRRRWRALLESGGVPAASWSASDPALDAAVAAELARIFTGVARIRPRSANPSLTRSTSRRSS